MRRSTQFRDQRGRRRPVKRILLLVSAVLLIFAASLLTRYLLHAQQARETLEEVRGEYNAQPIENKAVQTTPSPADQGLAGGPEISVQPISINLEPQARVTLAPDAAMLSELVSLYGKNKDLVAWLRSDGLSEIDFPIVKRDNSFYMDHDFYGRENLAGTVFLDQSCAILPRSDNLVLHGHNMKNGSMFGKLHFYLEEDFVKAQPMFTFSTLYETSVYVPYAVSIVSTDTASPLFTAFIRGDFNSGEDRLFYTQRLAELSLFEFPVDVCAEDRLLTLATCHGNEDSERLVLALRELRPEEEKATMAKMIRDEIKNKR